MEASVTRSLLLEKDYCIFCRKEDYGRHFEWERLIMFNNASFSVGQTLTIRSVSSNDTSSYVSRIVAFSKHTITFSLPYDSGRMILWPVGTRLEINIEQGKAFTFTTEILDRDLTNLKSYTVILPNSISKSTNREHWAGMTRVIAITSGKGGVGKTTFTINLAIALAKQGQRVYIVDVDLGSANVDVLMRLTPKYNITHLLSGEKNLIEITLQGPENIGIIPGGSGLQELTQLSETQFAKFIHSFNQLDGLADIILLDTGAGVSRDVSNFLLAADEIILVTTTEPHAIMDAYSITKVMQNLNSKAKQRLVVNRVEDSNEASVVSNRLINVIKYYLKTDVEYLGYICDDRVVSRSIKEQNPLMISYPTSIPAKNITSIANSLLCKPTINQEGISGFINKMISIFKDKSGR